MGEPEQIPDNVIVLRADDGSAEVVEDTPENREKRDKTAAERRAEFLFNKQGALARAGQLPRLLTGNLAAGVSNLMLVKLMQGELRPQTAKEAADIAKITHQIFREASGQTAGSVLSREERAGRLDQIDKLSVELAARAAAATETLGGAPQGDEQVPDLQPDAVERDEWEHDEPPARPDQ